MSTSSFVTALVFATLAACSVACSDASNEATRGQGQPQTTDLRCPDYCSAFATRCRIDVACSEVCAQPNGIAVISCAEQASCDDGAAIEACAAKGAPSEGPAASSSSSSGSPSSSSSSSSSGSPSSSSSSSSSGSSGTPAGGAWRCDATGSSAGFAGAQGEQCDAYRLPEVDPGAKCSTVGDKAMVRSSYYCLAKPTGYEVERRFCECK